MISVRELFESLGDPRQPVRQSGWGKIATGLERPERVLGRLIPRAIVDGADPNAPADTAKVRLVQLGAQALFDLANDPAQTLTPEQIAGLELLRLISGRPAMPVIGGRCTTPPPQWKFLHDEARERIDEVATCVGRIDIGPAHEGTGFVIGDRIVMTNRHVANALVKPGTKRTLREDQALAIDFDKQLGGGVDRFAVEEVLHVSDEPTIDLAIVKIAAKGERGNAPPPPMTIRNTRPSSTGVVYTVGYPAVDNTGDTPPEVMERIFGPDVGVKRVQPGLITATDWKEPRQFHHDCSTLGGSSGSCVVDFETGLVCGLHFRGFYSKRNYAVALWTLTNDQQLEPLLNFG